MTEIEIRHERLTNLLDEADSLISQLGGAKDAARKDMISQIDAVVKQADDCWKYVDLEQRRLGQSERASWKQILRESKARMNDIKREMKFQRAEGGSNTAAASGTDPALLTSQDLIAHGDKLQEASLAATDRILRDVEALVKSGAATAEQLEAQTQQLEAIHDDLYQIDDTLERANKIVKRMLRRTFTDKYMWCLIGLVFFAIVALVALKASGRDTGNTNLPDSLDQT